MFILLLFYSICDVNGLNQEDRESQWSFTKNRQPLMLCWFIYPDKHLLVAWCQIIHVTAEDFRKIKNPLTVFIIFLSSCEKTHKSSCAQITHTPSFPSSVLISDSSSRRGLIILKPSCWLRSSLTSMAVIYYLCWGCNEPLQPQRASASQWETWVHHESRWDRRPGQRPFPPPLWRRWSGTGFIHITAFNLISYLFIWIFICAD